MKDQLQLLALAIEQSSEGIAISDLQGKLIYSNGAFSIMHGYSPDEIIGKRLSIFHDKEQLPSVHAANRRLKKSGEFRGEIWHTRKDGSVFPAMMHNCLLRDGAGNPIALLGTMRDLTEIKDSENALWKSEELYRNLVEQQSELILRYTPDWRLTFVNEACCRYFDKKKEEIVGRSFMPFIFREDQEKLQDHLKSLSIDHPVVPYELRIVTPGGEVHWQQWTNRAVLDHRNRIIEFQSVGRDITGLKKIQKELLKANLVIRALSDCNQAVIHIKDEVELLEEICRIIINVGGYLMAWVGYSTQDEDLTVAPVAAYGHEKGYLDTVNITWKDTERGRGPVGTCIRTGVLSVVRNIQTHSDFAPWRVEATKRGYASILALPLFADELVIGSLAVYSSEPDAFDDDEINLFCKLTDNLSLGIDKLRSHEAQKKAEKALEQAHNELEKRVQERTAQLKDRQGKLKEQASRLQEVNTALNVLLKRREEDKKELEENILHALNEIVFPYLEKLRKTSLDSEQSVFVDILESNLADISSPFIKNLSSKFINLTPTELKVAQLIRDGRRSKEIAELLGLSETTILFHRQNVRNKLGLKRKGINLQTYLRTLSCQDDLSY